MLFLIAILFPIIAGTVVSVVKMPDGHTRNRLYAAVTILTDVLAVCALLYGKPVTLFKLAEGVTISFSPDPIGKYILAVVLILYTAVVFYAFEYMEHEERQNVFFAFLLISFGALMAVCVSGNLVTLYLSFESLTLTTFRPQIPVLLGRRRAPWAFRCIFCVLLRVRRCVIYIRRISRFRESGGA